MDAGNRQEYGDFQTPDELAHAVCGVLRQRGTKPASIIEPTCGLGSFLTAALNAFPGTQHIEGLEVNVSYVGHASHRLRAVPNGRRVRLHCANFFEVDWRARISDLPQPVLVIGNPPWVTNAKVGALGGTNLPRKSNFQKHHGLEAVTGKSNFDISEWMLIRLFEALAGKSATLAMLCKTTVARKALSHAWKTGIPFGPVALYRVDAKKHFSAAVEACLLVAEMHPATPSFDCPAFDSLEAAAPSVTFGFRDGHLIADVDAYEPAKGLCGAACLEWRSGIKHDSAEILEFTVDGTAFKNGAGEVADLEPDFVFPMFKGSAIARGAVRATSRFMLVPQRSVGDKTERLATAAPKTWAYLLAHAHNLDSRSSSIYRGRPRFSVFGIGDYTFAPWKVATSALYKKLAFRVVGPILGRPSVFDDTCNFLPCESEEEASAIAALLGTERATRFFDAFVFWDAKRPITIELLRRLNLIRLADELGEHALSAKLARRSKQVATHVQALLALR